jgi:hypothetical protein
MEWLIATPGEEVDGTGSWGASVLKKGVEPSAPRNSARHRGVPEAFGEMALAALAV